jgi:hypothetical protein
MNIHVCPSSFRWFESADSTGTFSIKSDALPALFYNKLRGLNELSILTVDASTRIVDTPAHAELRNYLLKCEQDDDLALATSQTDSVCREFSVQLRSYPRGYPV